MQRDWEIRVGCSGDWLAGGTLMPLRGWVGKNQKPRKVRHLSAGHPNGKKRFSEAAEAQAWVGR